MSIDLIRWKIHIPGFYIYFLVVGVFCLLNRKIFFTFDINSRRHMKSMYRFMVSVMRKEILFLKTKKKKSFNIIFARNCRISTPRLGPKRCKVIVYFQFVFIPFQPFILNYCPFLLL